MKQYDYAVINDDLDEAIENVKMVIKASHFGVTQSIVEYYEEEF